MGSKTNSNSTPYDPCAWAIEIGSDSVNCCVPSPDGKYIAIGFGKKTVRLYDYQNQQVIKDYEGCTYSSSNQTIIKVAFSPDGKYLAFGWEKKAKILDMESFEVVKEFDNESGVCQLVFCPNNKYLAVGTWDDKVNVYNLEKDSAVALVGSIKARTMQHVQRNQYSGFKMNIAPCWSPDGTNLITRWNKGAECSQISDEGITQGGSLDHKDDVWDFSFSPDGAQLLVGYGRDNASLWDFQNRSQIKDIQSCTHSVKNEALIHNTWSPAGDAFAVRWEHEVIIQNQNEVVAKFELPKSPLYMIFSPDGQKVAIGTKADLFIANLQTKEMTNKFECIGYDKDATTVIAPEWIGNDCIIGRKEDKVRIWKC